MENRKFIITILWALIFPIASQVSAYSLDTHSYLTNKSIDFYNQHYNQKISTDLIPYLIDGSRKEDEPPRWMNHFYDPIFERGLTDPVLGTWENSKSWAQDDRNQNNFTYKIPATIASILTAIQQKRISALSTESVFTWKTALRYWIQGEKEGAMASLGHVLHLLQDATVPDHTRNDPHPNNSPYEDFAHQNVIENKNAISAQIFQKNPLDLNSLDAYFENLARYSNENFYSKDTIGIQSGYTEPQPDFIDRCGNYYCGVAKDSEAQEYKLFIREKSSLLNTISLNKESASLILNKEGGDIIMSDYWRLLSAKAVQGSAGVINLFFEEAEKNKNNPEFTDKKTSLLGQVLESIKNLFTKKDASIGEIGISNPNTPQEQNDDPQTNPQEQQDAQQGQQPNTFLVTRVIDGDTIVLENGEIVRYIGINAPELFDNPEKNDCFALEAKKENERLVLNKRVSLEKGGDDRDMYGRLLRYVWVDQELINAALIQKGAAYSFNFKIPHPKESTFELIESTAKENKVGLWGPNCTENETEDVVKNNLSPISCSFETTKNPTRSPVVINEVAWMGAPQNANSEWIELKNVTSLPVDITGWSLIDASEQIAVVFGESKKNATIPPQSFYLLERSSDTSVPNIIADTIYSGTLSNSNEGIRLFDKNCMLVDEAMASPSWPAGDNSSKKTMERNSSITSWHTSQYIGGTPKAHNSFGEQGQGGGTPTQQTPQQESSSPQFYPIVINEIMYDLSGSDSRREWVELYNKGTTTVDLSGWKLYENETNHSLSQHQGGLLLAENSYAIVADNSEIFLEDNPLYTGILIESAFSLNNESELIAIKNQTLLIDSFSYNAEMGASGNGNSLQKFDDKWEEALPTPGAQNTQLPPAQEGVLQAPEHLVISELQISGEDADDEFIEIYNPTQETISLKNYSLQYISGQSETLANITKKNLGENVIEPLSFFLVTNSNGKFASSSDISQATISLSGNTTGATILLVATTTQISSLNDPTIVDMLSYGTPVLGQYLSQIPQENQSLERMALRQGACMPATGNEEFIGNGCDTNSGDDFSIRTSPNPQSTTNLPEPRNAPTQVSNIIAQHFPSQTSISLAWDESLDAFGTNHITYEIKDGENDDVLENTTSTSSVIQYNEVGRNYTFIITAKDRDGLSSPEASADPIVVNSFLTDLLVYPNPDDPSTHIIETRYDNPHFIPDTHNPSQSTWKMIVFYLNADAVKDKYIYDPPEWSRQNDILPILYDHCSGGTSEEVSLIIPDTQERCGTSGGAYSSSLEFDLMKENHLIINSTKIEDHPNILSENNYITAAFYRTFQIMPSDGRISYFELVAVDKTRYPIEGAPIRQQPIFTQGELLLTFQESSSSIFLEWPPATNTDPFAHTISYEIQLSPEMSWRTGITGTSTQISVLPDDVFEISLRARNEFGAISETLSTSWSYPQPTWFIDQTQSDGFGEEFGTKSQNCTQCPSTASLQSITPESDATINSVVLRIKHPTNANTDPGNVRLAIYPDAGGLPDFTNQLGQSTQNLYELDGASDTIFTFSPISLTAGTTYWLVLDVSGYSNGDAAFQRNQWRSAIANSNPYPNGVAGKGAGASCEGFNKDYCSFKIPYPSSNADWYMRIK